MKTDLYQQITDSIISIIEAGRTGDGITWAQDAAGGMPVNFKTNAAYRGINTLILWSAARANGYSSNAWLTYKQAAELGGQVRKGEKAELCVFFKMLEIEDKEAETTEDGKKEIPMASPFWVFNLDQIDGIEKPQANTLRNDWEQVEAAEAILKASGAKINEQGQKAFYRPSTDEITMPERARFASAKDFYSVALHELTHWTGAKHRLNRDFSGRFGSEAYAFEELIAELGSAFLNSEIGFLASQIPNHASYIDSWLKVLKGDKRAIFTAASQASKAHSFIMNLVQPEAKAA